MRRYARPTQSGCSASESGCSRTRQRGILRPMDIFSIRTSRSCEYGHDKNGARRAALLVPFFTRAFAGDRSVHGDPHPTAGLVRGRQQDATRDQQTKQLRDGNCAAANWLSSTSGSCEPKARKNGRGRWGRRGVRLRGED